MASIGSLIGILGLETARFEAGIKKAEKAITRFRKMASRSFKRVSKSFDRLAKRTASYGTALLTVAGPAVMGLYLKQSFAMIDAQAKLSDTLGISIKSLAGFELAGQRTGATVEQVKKSLEKLAINTEDAARGIGTAKDAFDTLGISAKEFIKLPIDVQALVMADALKEVDNATLKLGLTYSIFGRQGTNMIKFLNLGSETLKVFMERAVKLNIAISRFDAAKIEAANDAMLEVNEAIKGVSNTLAIKLAPFITDLSERFVGAALEGKGFGDEVDKAFKKVISIIGGAADAVNVMRIGIAGAEAGILSIAQAWANVVTIVPRVGIEIANALGQGPAFEDTPIGAFVARFNEEAEKARQNLIDLTSAPLPSEQLEKWVAAVEKVGVNLDKHISTLTVIAETPFLTKLFREIDQLNIQFDNVFAHWTEGTASMKDAFIGNLRKMISELGASQLANMFQAIIGPQNAGAGGIFKQLLGFQHGGDFTVGGGGGTDKSVVAFRATRGETVSVTPRNGGGNGTGGVTIVNNNDFRGSSLNVGQVQAMVKQNGEQTMAQIHNEMRRRRF